MPPPAITHTCAGNCATHLPQALLHYCVFAGFLGEPVTFDAHEIGELFAADGALQPPFQKPIVGRDAVLRFFREDCQNLKLIPERGVAESADDGYTQIKVTGKVQTPWFGAAVGMNMAWRFLVGPDNKIFFVAIDLLASPKELLNFVR